MIKIAIDVGHADGTGAAAHGYEEHEVALGVAEELKCCFDNFRGEEKYQVDIIDFPNKTNKQDLAASVNAINAGDYDVAISLHCDAAYTTSVSKDGMTTTTTINEKARGAHVCYYSQRGKSLAEEIASGLCNIMIGRAERTQLRKDLYFLKRTKPVAVLVECGFITNKDDVNVMVEAPEIIARSIALRLAAWCEVNIK